jgi:hypothetical protein
LFSWYDNPDCGVVLVGIGNRKSFGDGFIAIAEGPCMVFGNNHPTRRRPLNSDHLMRPSMTREFDNVIAGMTGHLPSDFGSARPAFAKPDLAYENDKRRPFLGAAFVITQRCSENGKD